MIHQETNRQPSSSPHFHPSPDAKPLITCSIQRTWLDFDSEKRNQKGLYLFQDASEPLGLTVDDNLSLLPLVQILEHFQERGLRHGLHVHRGHQPVPLCCCVQNLLQHRQSCCMGKEKKKTREFKIEKVETTMWVIMLFTGI